MNPPPYFEAIRSASAARWDQLESDPELAGPWHQLFRQVQSPRHVLSELLQNADDAGATEASARVEGGTFVFTHNGGDFIEEHFASLCRFGYSNKRTLHTIGFRGIGFKSTFSLGASVELRTSTLSVRFHRSRFTEPVWLSSDRPTRGLTELRVEITDDNRLRDIEGNLGEWQRHPLSLLFFRNLRSLKIGDNVSQWQSEGPGPVDGSEWFRAGDEGDRHLVVRSREENFPDDALEEIRKERSLRSNEDMEIPPCRVELVVGSDGRLHVVLPTGVECDLPFACNAPFIQDPARVQIKEPSTSPTNRWLLQRAGRLAADTMLQWLALEAIPSEERANAYALMPNVDRESSSLQGGCSATVKLAFAAAVANVPVLLTYSGRLLPVQSASAYPAALFRVWNGSQLEEYFGVPPLSSEIVTDDRKKLLEWKWTSEITLPKVVERLNQAAPPRPITWEHLHALWRYLSTYRPGRSSLQTRDLHIVPVPGSSLLQVSSGLVRLPQSHDRLSEADLAFVANHLLCVDPEWLDFIHRKKETADSIDQSRIRDSHEVVYKFLESLELGNASASSMLIDRAASSLFSNGRVNLTDAVRIAQIAARIKVEIGENFRVFDQSGKLRRPGDGCLVDLDGNLESLLPPSWHGEILHSAYTEGFTSCSRDEWAEWVTSGRAGLYQIPTICPVRERRFSNEDQARAETRKRGYVSHWNSRYSSPDFYLADWDFHPDLVAYWEQQKGAFPNIWAEVIRRLLSTLGHARFWKPVQTEQIPLQNQYHQAQSAMSAKLVETSPYNKSQNPIIHSDLAPAWILRCRNLSCLPDTRGFPHLPAELVRRTSATESYIDVEPFLHRDLDTDINRDFLDLLGVRTRPLGPASVLERLRALALAETPPVTELHKWYTRLDQILISASSGDLAIIREAFTAEPLIYTADKHWKTAHGVFQFANEEDVPGVEVLDPAIVSLALWRQIGVSERPTVELAIRWLDSLGSSVALSPDEAARVSALLGRHGPLIWEETGHWMTLESFWCPVTEIDYAFRDSGGVSDAALFPSIRARTADFRMLTASVAASTPFAAIPSLASRLDYVPGGVPPVGEAGETIPWLLEVASALLRICWPDESETQRILQYAIALSTTRIQIALNLSVTPYLDGTPAGQAVRAEVAWIPDRLRIYVGEVSSARLAKIVPEEISRFFDRGDIGKALAYAYERDPRQVVAYFEENFTLSKSTELSPSSSQLPSPPLVAESFPNGAECGGNEKPSSLDHLPYGGKDREGDGPVPESTESSPSVSSAKKSPQPDLMERFLHKAGFKHHENSSFHHKDGSVIEKISTNVFPWELRNPSGDVIRRYWCKPQCLEKDGLEVPHEVWAFLTKRPELVSLVLGDTQGRPVEFSGNVLLERVEMKEIGIFPATYRLICRDLN